MGGCVGNEKKPQNQPLNNKQAEKAQIYAPERNQNQEEAKEPSNVRFVDPPSHHSPEAADKGAGIQDKIDGQGIRKIDDFVNEDPHQTEEGKQKVETSRLNVQGTKQEEKQSPIKNLDEPHKAEEHHNNEEIDIKSLSEHSKKHNHSDKQEAEPQSYPTHQKPESKINVIYAPDIQQLQRQQRIQATQKRYNHLSNLKAVSEVPSQAEEMSSKKVQGRIRDQQFVTLEKESQRNKLVQQSAPASGKEGQKVAEPEKEVEAFQEQEERVHGQEQFLQAYQQGFQLPIFEIAISS